MNRTLRTVAYIATVLFSIAAIIVVCLYGEMEK